MMKVFVQVFFIVIVLVAFVYAAETKQQSISTEEGDSSTISSSDVESQVSYTDINEMSDDNSELSISHPTSTTDFKTIVYSSTSLPEATTIKINKKRKRIRKRKKVQKVWAVTDEKLASISQDLFEVDLNNGGGGKYVTINPQSRASQNPTIDAAPNPLLIVNHTVYSIPTYSMMLTLLDNYNRDVAAGESVTNAEKLEEKNFLDAILQSNVMKKLQEFLIQEGLISNANNFRKELQRLWFDQYSRSKGISVVGSSGFEHIFIGESQGTKSLGFHSWITFNSLEEGGKVNYQGYNSWRPLPGQSGGLINTRFVVDNRVKSSSMFIGTSPELEIAYYTVCFLARPNAQCKVYPKGRRVAIQTWTLTYNGKKYIGSAYPQL